MIYLIKPLIVNITIIFSLMFNANLFFPFSKRKPLNFKQQTILGLFSAFSAKLCMLYPIETLEDTNFDFRMIPILIVTLYGGWYPGLLCTAIVVMLRYLIGGEYVYVGIAVSILALGIGVLFRSGFLRSANKVLYGVIVISFYYLVYIFILFSTVSFLDINFYIVYFLAFSLTFTALIYTVEKLIIANQQFDETLYLDKLSTVSQMAAAFAHEIRNPITTVRGFIQFINSDTKDENLKQFAPLILDELDRTNKIITNYLTVARPTNFTLSYIDVNKALQDSVELLRPFGSYRNVSIDLKLEGEHYIYSDEQHLKQVLMNIIKNGIEAVEEEQGGYVKIVKKPADERGQIEITFVDNGIGMSEEQLEKLGLPYYTTKTKGTGLGSMITNRLIHEMKGKIHYESKVHNGTSVTVILPTVSKE
ncbi:ATP-binding protein [Sutcliffiella horikoshii]|uniref:ATP-binding protein n=1 Tax=Sutcliffiella horikoshii TaxID=79883 RepID=UPI001CBB6500|nr:ATP-binding protein [Sutcliffiella horikoshii]UAL48859.1 ATP-binding protein [Sutcliffiella horikoshii]